MRQGGISALPVIDSVSIRKKVRDTDFDECDQQVHVSILAERYFSFAMCSNIV